MLAEFKYLISIAVSVISLQLNEIMEKNSFIYSIERCDED